MRCIVPSCKHDSRNTSKSKGITFHIFPTEPSLRTAWLKALDKEGWNPRERSAVCSNHFLTDDLYMTRSGLRKVRAGAVPIVMQNAAKCDYLITPSDVKACRICFATDCNLYSMMMYKNLYQAYEILTGLSVETEDNIPPYLCTECSHRLLNCVRFRTRSLRGHVILVEIVKKHEYITLETIKSINREQNLLSSNLGTTHHKPDHYDLEVTHEDKEFEVFTEEQADIQDLPLIQVTVEEIKPENNSDVDDEVKMKNGEDQEAVNDEAVYGDAFVGKDYSSDDSQPLGQLEKKVKRTRKRKKDSKPPKDPTQPKIDRRRKPFLNEDLSETLFTISDLTVEEQKPPKDPTQPKIDRRRKPFLNEDLSETLFTISDLTVEEQLAEIEKRQESSNYKNSMFKCTICYKGFLDRDAFNGHMTRHSNQCGEFKCEICKTHFKHPHALRKHITAHHTQRFSCNQCPYVTTHRQTARLHERWHKGTKYKCPHCEDEFLKFTTYMGHVRIKHPSDFVCSLCGYCFVSEKGIELHKKLKHRLENTQIPDDGPLCELCNVRFVSQEAYRRHLSVSGKHNADKQSKEPKEIKLRKTRTGARRNARTSSCDSNSKVFPALLRSGPIPCEQCGLQLEDSRAYHSHFRRMHPDKNRTNYPSMKSPCMCEVCGRMFQSFALLKDHRWTHTGERPFSCESCGKCFRMRQRLVAHRRIHDQMKSTYTCALCGKHFSTHSNRQRHMFIHTGLKPFKCEMCGKSFKHASEKRAHITYVHLKKPWPKRSRGKRRTDRPAQMQPQGVVNTGASEINTAQAMWPPCESKMADMNMIGDKSLYYNMKM